MDWCSLQAWGARQRSISGSQGDPSGDFSLGDSEPRRGTCGIPNSITRGEVFPGAWWHGRVGRMRSLGETHFRPSVVDQALVLQENHPLRLCVIPRPLSDWSSDLRAADHLCTQCAKNMQRTHSLLCDMLCSISCKHGEQSKAGEGAGKIARIHTVALARCICAQCHLHALEGSAIMVWKQ